MAEQQQQQQVEPAPAPMLLNQGGVTEVFVTEVDESHEALYREWIHKIHEAEVRFPGFKGMYVQAPHGKERAWITFLHFDTAENLDRWINSNERKAILAEASTMIRTLERHRLASPFGGWFKTLASKGPPAWKQGLIVLLVLYPIVMLEIKYLNPHLVDLNKALGVFIGNFISVALVTWPLVPLAIYFFKDWLAPSEENPKKANFLGTLVILALFALEILLFWKFI